MSDQKDVQKSASSDSGSKMTKSPTFTGHYNPELANPVVTSDAKGNNNNRSSNDNNSDSSSLFEERTSPIDKKKLKKWNPERDDFPNIFLSTTDEEKRKALIEKLPPWKVKKMKKAPKIFDTVSGPYNIQFPQDIFVPWICGKAISTYPHLPGKTQRDGDPICDSYCVQLLENNITIAVVADGCNWGRRPMEASNIAKTSFVEYLRNHCAEISDLQDCGHFLLQAISYCHSKVIEGKEDIWEAGTTTLLGGILLPLKSKNEHKNDKTSFAWVSVTIGDCKSYHYSLNTRTILDLTEGNRQNVLDAKDPGGRLGPYVGEGLPDLRNISLRYRLCEEGDIILLLSDGVHDNLDPQTLGKTPGEINSEWNSIPSWNEFPPEISEKELERVKTTYMLRMLADDLVCGGEEVQKMRNKVFSLSAPEDDSPVSPLNITTRIMKHCLNVTARGREWMEQNPKEKLPSDYAAYPGKMDHATCVTIKVGKFENVLSNKLGRQSLSKSSTSGSQAI
mmetsp:Transcript_25870/g.36385  ORF Transcript_25870/g.36385 Transcript_25870/m.36385 type:complete len:506 (+) Transcript_25870:477-1994(+)|eukprot:CAMPEP_0168552940 /NCGR_PEP_ID=MMETSP0413-20121227/6986_1 /TAXON_ID=136452 /ORGANISM="Filamoeba nolandi, Strain NC-AS-23-1" /LENGTH=505 /DNA_ID=CAMNT_0008583591 /DNA_START=471 /DNA_END=1988 /DNA_ORIENTATION=+